MVCFRRQVIYEALVRLRLSVAVRGCPFLASVVAFATNVVVAMVAVLGPRRGVFLASFKGAG